MPPKSNWRSPTGGQAQPGRPEFAAEFLRRNRRYSEEYARMIRHITSGTVNATAAHAAFARRWGLSFRGRPI